MVTWAEPKRRYGSWNLQFMTSYSKLLLSDVKDALDNMNAMNQHSVHRHLFGLEIKNEI
jgi:hypothetical protein